MLWQLFTLFAIGAIASFIGSLLSGTTSAMALGMMMLTGIPPAAAVGIYRVGIIGSRVGGFFEYLRAGKIHWPIIAPLCVCSFLGALIGANLLVKTDEAILSKVSGVLLTVFLIFAVIDRTSGIERKQTSPTKRAWGYLLYFLMSIWGGFFPAGTGLMFLHIYLLLFGLTILEIKGTDRIPALFLDFAAILVMAPHGLINPLHAAAFLPGMIVGGTLGARLALRIGDKFLKIIVVISAVIMAALLFSRS